MDRECKISPLFSIFKNWNCYIIYERGERPVDAAGLRATGWGDVEGPSAEPGACGGNHRKL